MQQSHSLLSPTLLGRPGCPIMGASSLSSSTAAATILHLVLLLAAARRHGATDYTVGDSAGWTIGPNYLTWSQKYNFTAGDALVFEYVKEQHNVYRVTQEEFRTCEPANHTNTMGVWATGHDVVNLTVPGDYYFLCNVAGHCLGGMKFYIAVAAPPPPPPPSPPPPALPPPPPPPASSGGSVPSSARRIPLFLAAAIGLLVVI